MKSIEFSPPTIGEDEISAVISALKSGWLSIGPKTLEFEKKFAEYVGCKHAISVNSCTNGLFLALKAIGICEGDEVITTPFTFCASANVICHCDATPVFVDIDKDTFNIDISKIEDKITKKTKAILIVHYGGQLVDIDKVNNIAKRHNLKVIEDSAHAIGIKYPNGKMVGNSGNLTSFSFYATKNLTTGEGGMITTNDDIIAEYLKNARLHGIDKGAWKRYSKEGNWRYDVTVPGFKANMIDITATIGLCQLKKINDFNTRRKKIADMYEEGLKNIKKIKFHMIKNETCRHLFPILIDNYNRDKLIEDLKKKGVSTSVHFIPVHMMSYYKNKYNYDIGDFPVTEKIFSKILSLPLHAGMCDDDVKYVIDSLKEILN